MVGKSHALQSADPAPAVRLSNPPSPNERIAELTKERDQALSQVEFLTQQIVAMGKQLEGLKQRLTRSPLTNLTRSRL
ncbi:MAG TPA: hypothetical protein VK797_23295 [Tepidisphaeraceae bacterium]|jgi:hypothetical protein|nr:hypothetical protein [Tepidisphaeraceae bacterium]